MDREKSLQKLEQVRWQSTKLEEEDFFRSDEEFPTTSSESTSSSNAPLWDSNCTKTRTNRHRSNMAKPNDIFAFQIKQLLNNLSSTIDQAGERNFIVPNNENTDCETTICIPGVFHLYSSQNATDSILNKLIDWKCLPIDDTHDISSLKMIRSALLSSPQALVLSGLLSSTSLGIKQVLI